jgi:hypothetical protein
VHHRFSNLVLAERVKVDFVDGAPGGDHKNRRGGMRVEAYSHVNSKNVRGNGVRRMKFRSGAFKTLEKTATML